MSSLKYIPKSVWCSFAFLIVTLGIFMLMLTWRLPSAKKVEFNTKFLSLGIAYSIDRQIEISDALIVEVSQLKAISEEISFPIEKSREMKSVKERSHSMMLSTQQKQLDEKKQKLEQINKHLRELREQLKSSYKED